MADQMGVPAPWLWALILTALPLLVLATTSFVKIAMVLALVRNALGLGAVPSGAVVSLWALMLSLHVMAPAWTEIAQRGQRLAARQPETLAALQQPLSPHGLKALVAVAQVVAPPLRGFLQRHAGDRERGLFVELSTKARPATPLAKDHFAVLLPAFLITELAEGLQIGFVIFLPFLVVDLVVAALLASLGMQGLSPTAVALPFKLMLFGLVDGFYLLSRALVQGYL